MGAGGPFAWYTSRIQDSIKKVLSANKKARTANYDLQIKLWLKQDGSVERFELADSTGNADLDQSIKLALAKVEPPGQRVARRLEAAGQAANCFTPIKRRILPRDPPSRRIQ